MSDTTTAPAATPDALPDDGPWSKAWNVVSETAGNVEKGITDAFSNAKQAVSTFQLPWEKSGADLAAQTKNEFPPIDTTAYAAQQSKPSVPFSDLFNRLVGTESGGQHTDASGGLTTSPKGAKGITQVMPKTGDNPGFGVTPLQNNSKEEYLRFGNDYLQALIKNFGGDQQKAVAAYNAGPGAVDRAAAKADKNGGNFLSFLPIETQKYVTKILGNGLAAVTGSSNANASADFTDYLKTNKTDTGPTVTTKKGEKPGTFEYQSNGLAPIVVDTIQKKFPQFVDAINTKVSGEPASAGNTAEYGGLGGDKIKLGNLKGAVTTWKDWQGKKTGDTGVTSMDQNEAIATTLHELMHARMSKIGSFNDGLGKDWKSMLNDAADAGFPSVNKGATNGDTLNEFLATATTLKSMQKADVAPGGRYIPVAKALPEMEAKYPWLKQYIINYINPEAANNASNRQAVEQGRNQ